MDDHDYHLMVPRRLDDPPKFLFWDFDVAIVWIGVVFMGIAGNFFITSLILAFAASYMVQKAKSGQQKGYGLHMLYWHLPIKLFKRTPPSCVREFIG